jgi:site-specific recombinase XerD
VRYEAGVFTKKFGNILITQIPRNDHQLWVRKLKLEPKTKKNIMGTVKLIFDHAIKLGLIKDNPTIGVELPKIDQAEPERFAASQCELLLKTGVRTKSPALPAVVIELFTGARPAEVARTGWQKVSLKEKRINIPGKAGKTHQYRWVSVPPILRQWLIFFGIKEKGPIMRRGTVSTNVYLRRLHNFALDLGWVGRAVIVRSQWPKGKHKKKRAITWEEHCRIVERDGNVERRDFYHLLWQSGAPQGDLAGLDAEEDIDRRARTFRFFRKKTDSVVFQRFGDGAAEILAHCHKRARSFRIRPHYVPVTGPLNSRSAAKGWALAASRSIPTATLCASSPGSTPVKCPRRRWIGEQGQRTNLFRTGVQ